MLLQVAHHRLLLREPIDALRLPADAGACVTAGLPPIARCSLPRKALKTAMTTAMTIANRIRLFMTFPEIMPQEAPQLPRLVRYIAVLDETKMTAA